MVTSVKPRQYNTQCKANLEFAGESDSHFVYVPISSYSHSDHDYPLEPHQFVPIIYVLTPISSSVHSRFVHLPLTVSTAVIIVSTWLRPVIVIYCCLSLSTVGA